MFYKEYSATRRKEISAKQHAEALNCIAYYTKKKVQSQDQLFGSNQMLLGVISTAIHDKNPDYIQSRKKKRPTTMSLEELIMEAEKGTLIIEDAILDEQVERERNKSPSPEPRSPENELIEELLSNSDNVRLFTSLSNIITEDQIQHVTWILGV